MKRTISNISGRIAHFGVALLFGVSVSTSLASSVAFAEVAPDDSVKTSAPGMMHTMSESEVDQNNRTQGAEFLRTMRKDHRAQTKERRMAFCERRKTVLDQRFSTLGSVAQRHLNTLNTAFEKVQAYQTQNKLNVANYDGLVAEANAAKTNAQSAVDALKALKGTTIDCNSADPASTVATVRQAVKAAHDALKTYRTSVKALISALRAAANTPTSTATDNQ